MIDALFRHDNVFLDRFQFGFRGFAGSLELLKVLGGCSFLIMRFVSSCLGGCPRFVEVSESFGEGFDFGRRVCFPRLWVRWLCTSLRAWRKARDDLPSCCVQFLGELAACEELSSIGVCRGGAERFCDARESGLRWARVRGFSLLNR